MLPDLSASHILIVAAVALIVVGPKDLPMLLRKVGGVVRRMRAMADEFRASFDEMARQSELEDLRKEVNALRHAQIDPLGAVHEAAVDDMFKDIEAEMSKPLDDGWQGPVPPGAEAQPDAEPMLPLEAPAVPAKAQDAAPAPAAKP